MQAMDDIALLREYAGRNSEAAFSELVSRHIGFVYSAALRQVRDRHLAEEITQAVFILLAQKAGKMSDKTILTGWLFRTTRFAALAQMRARAKRFLRTATIEKELQMQTEMSSAASDEIWNQMSPLLDEALAALGEKDRQAVLLRFFENKSLAEVGSALGAGEDTARKRVGRALEKLHFYFSRRGVTSTTATLAEKISVNSIQAAPVALAKSVTAVALAKGAATSTSTLTIIKGALKIMAWTKAKTAAVVGAAALLATGTTFIGFKGIHALRVAMAPDIQGAWEGVANVPIETETIQEHGVLKLVRTNGVYHGTADNIEQGVRDLPVRQIVYDYPHLRVQLDASGAVFEGTLNKHTMEISGVYREAGLQLATVLKHTDQPDTVPDPLRRRDYARRDGSDLQGLWKGVLKAPNRSIRLNFKIAELADGTCRGQMDNLDGASGQWLTVIYQSPSLKLVVNSVAGMFEGRWDETRTKLVGRWIESGQSMPLTLERAVPLYQPIPDNEPQVTERMRSLKMEELRAEDCTPEFWQELQQSRKSENSEMAKAIAAALGTLRNVTLVQRTNDDLGRPSYLYRMEYENMNALIRIVLDGQKIAYAHGESEPE